MSALLSAAGLTVSIQAVPIQPVAVQPAPPISAPSIDLIGVLPILIMLGAACLAVIVEAALPKKQRFATQVVLAIAAIVAAGVATVVLGAKHHYVVTFAGAVAVDSATYVMWGSLLALALVSVPVMADRVIERGGVFAAQASAVIGSERAKVATAVATPMQTEVFPLALFAVGGMLVFPAASDLLTLFVALEVLSLGTALATDLQLRAWDSQYAGHTFGPHRGTAETLKSINNVSVAVFAATLVVGIIDGVASYYAVEPEDEGRSIADAFGRGYRF